MDGWPKQQATPLTEEGPGEGPQGWLLPAMRILWQRITFGDITALVDLANSKGPKEGLEGMDETSAAFLVRPKYEAAFMARRFDAVYNRIKVRGRCGRTHEGTPEATMCMQLCGAS